MQGEPRWRWRFRITGQHAREFELTAATLAPSAAYSVTPTLVLIVCHEGEGSRGSQLLFVDIHAGELVDRAILKGVAISPDVRFLLGERWNSRFDEDHVGSVLLMYDLQRAAALNRAPSARRESFDVGIPVYPEHFRTSRIYTIPAEQLHDGRQISRKPVWVDDRRAACVYRRGAQTFLVTMTFSGGGEVLEVKEQPFDPALYVSYSQYADVLRVEEMSVAAITDTSFVIKMRVGPGWVVRDELIQVEVK